MALILKRKRRFLPVIVRCPACHEEWLTAIIELGTWWAESPEMCASRVICEYCGQDAPMQVVKNAGSLEDHSSSRV